MSRRREVARTRGTGILIQCPVEIETGPESSRNGVPMKPLLVLCSGLTTTLDSARWHLIFCFPYQEPDRQGPFLELHGTHWRKQITTSEMGVRAARSRPAWKARKVPRHQESKIKHTEHLRTGYERWSLLVAAMCSASVTVVDPRKCPKSPIP